MKILLTADPDLPVPPKLYGGIERIVDLLATGLQSCGQRQSENNRSFIYLRNHWDRPLL